MSKKYENFVKAVREKPATSLPGVGPVTGERLKMKGIFTAEALLAKYQNMRSKFEFEDWLINTTGANSKQAVMCSRALEKWSKRSRSSAVPYSRDERVTKTYNRRTVTVTEENYQCSRSRRDVIDFDSSDFSDSEEEYYDSMVNYRKF